MKRISLEELIKTGYISRKSKDELRMDVSSYKDQYHYIINLIEQGAIKPVKASATNGKSPALHLEYWLLEEKKDYSELKEELLYKMHPELSIDYYLGHLDVYNQDREWVLLLNEFLKQQKEQLLYTKSVNERSFEIWNREKFLTKEQGKRILKRCGFDMDYLNVYETTEPLAYYSYTRQTPQNILIVENKDTFFSMRRHLLGISNTIFGMPVGTLIYGAGKGIFKSFKDFEFCVEPYMTAEENQIYYFGDLDYEGIGIYENFASVFCGKWEIKPFVEGYRVMLKKAEKIEQLPVMKTGQNKHIHGLFFSYFSDEMVEQMKKILELGRYIPQEILNITDL